MSVTNWTAQMSHNVCPPLQSLPILKKWHLAQWQPSNVNRLVCHGTYVSSWYLSAGCTDILNGTLSSNVLTCLISCWTCTSMWYATSGRRVAPIWFCIRIWDINSSRRPYTKNTTHVVAIIRQVTWLVVTEVQREKLRAGYRAPSLQRMSYLRTLLLCCASCIYHCRVWYQVLFLCTYSTFEHHPHPLDYPCPKFCFRHTLCCWARPWREIPYSINHSSSLFHATGTEAYRFWKYYLFIITNIISRKNRAW